MKILNKFHFYGEIFSPDAFMQHSILSPEAEVRFNWMNNLNYLLKPIIISEEKQEGNFHSTSQMFISISIWYKWK